MYQRWPSVSSGISETPEYDSDCAAVLRVCQRSMHAFLCIAANCVPIANRSVVSVGYSPVVARQMLGHILSSLRRVSGGEGSHTVARYICRVWGKGACFIYWINEEKIRSFPQRPCAPGVQFPSLLVVMRSREWCQCSPLREPTIATACVGSA